MGHVVHRCRGASGGVAMMDQLLQQVRAGNAQQLYEDDWPGSELGGPAG